MESTLVQLSPEIVAIIQQILDNQSDDVSAENIQIIADGMYTDVEGCLNISNVIT